MKTAYQDIDLAVISPAFSFAEFQKFLDNLVRTKPFKANIILKAFATMFMGLIIHRGGVVKRDT